jgi:hypothetical protein
MAYDIAEKKIRKQKAGTKQVMLCPLSPRQPYNRTNIITGNTGIP